ncbi:MAG: beta-N-acetylhexosaminidase [Magnetococcales bacterium]|nr:beta-N-acetylhexosaminidase [Magnetococcales bacterium]
MNRYSNPAGHLVTGLSGKILHPEERQWIMEHKPAGVILFSRNLGTLDELVPLIQSIRLASDPPPTVWLDQEGGRVQRLRTPLTRYPTAQALGTLHEQDPVRGARLARLWGTLGGRELRTLGIGVNCAPVLDLREPGAHPVIGDRSFGSEPETVIALAGAWLDGFSRSGGMTVGKHFPGHGAAQVDSHRQLPVIDRDRTGLEKRELAPFRRLAARLPAMMTAHLVARGLDDLQPATWSPVIMTGLLRREWGYRGLLVSDAIEMQALDGPLDQRTRRAIRAGCDLVLCCTGRLEDNETARLGIKAALEDLATTSEGPGPVHDATEIAKMLAPFRIPPGNWRQLLSDPEYRRDRAELETLADDALGADPTAPS